MPYIILIKYRVILDILMGFLGDGMGTNNRGRSS
jgi:hypothetical protein